MRLKPITPEEATQRKEDMLPDFVIQAFNDKIVEHYNGFHARVPSSEVKARILTLNKASMFESFWFDIIEIYAKRGWDVVHRDGYFDFKRQREDNDFG